MARAQLRGAAVGALLQDRVVEERGGAAPERRGVVRRAKLYYLRDRRGKSARIAERQSVRPSKGVVVPETGKAEVPAADEA